MLDDDEIVATSSVHQSITGDEDRWRLTLSLEFPTVFAQDGQIVLYVSAQDTTFNQIATNAAEKLSREAADLVTT